MVCVGAVALLAGVTIGWWIGSWASCGTACQFDVDLFAAIGTWVGGVGLALAALAFTISQDRETRRRRREEAFGTAIMCVLRPKPVVSQDGNLVRVEFAFQNKTANPIDNVSAHLIGDTVFRRDARVWPGRTWGFQRSPSDLGLPTHVESEPLARALIRSTLTPRLVFCFTVNGSKFLRSDGRIFPFESAPKHLLPSPNQP